MSNGLLYTVIALSFSMLIVSWLRRSSERSRTARDLTREQLARLRDQGRIRQSIEELLVELEQAAKRMATQTDAQVTRLEQALRAADDRIARLERLVAKAAELPAPRPVASPVAAPATVARAPVMAPQPVALPRPVRAGSKPAAAVHPSGDWRQQVHQLAEQGLSAEGIAHKLSRSLGEVELCLNLHRFAGHAPAPPTPRRRITAQAGEAVEAAPV